MILPEIRREFRALRVVTPGSNRLAVLSEARHGAAETAELVRILDSAQKLKLNAAVVLQHRR